MSTTELFYENFKYFFGFCSRSVVRGKVRLSEEAEKMPDGLHQPATVHARENICQDALPRRRDEGKAGNDDQPSRGQNSGTKHPPSKSPVRYLSHHGGIYKHVISVSWN